MKSLSYRALASFERRLFSVLERFHLRNGAGPDIAVRPLQLLTEEIHSPSFPDMFRATFPEEAKSILHEAEKNSFLGEESMVPWHTDVVSGFYWDPKTFYADIVFGNKKGVDVKDPWDRSRCHHLVRLGEAYILTKDEKYAKSFVAQIQDWIDKNPRGRGVNWVSPMEIAIRACNWLLAWDFFNRSPSIPPGFVLEFARSLHAHGSHISSRLEHGGSTSTNHYIANLVGLGYIGAALGHEKWANKAEWEMENEIQAQTYDDGMSYEASTAYHRLSTEMFFYFGHLSTRCADRFSLNEVEFCRHLNWMIDFVAQLMDTKGRVPLIGDNDSGRFHSFLSREDGDMRYLVALGRSVTMVSAADISDTAWLFGFAKKEPDFSLIKVPQGSSGLIALQQDGQVMVVSAQPNGASGVGHHTHNDKLAVTLSVDGQPILIDPGTAAYTSDPELRNQFRSTHMHNTITIDNREQNRFVSGSLFKLCNDAKASVVEHRRNYFVIAMHTGYERLDHWVRHGRKVEWKDGAWVIGDKLTGIGRHTFKWTFVLDGQVTAEIVSSQKVILKAGHVQIEMTAEGTRGAFALEDTIYAPAYRKTLPTKRLVLQDEGSVPLDVTFTIKKVYR